MAGQTSPFLNFDGARFTQTAGQMKGGCWPLEFDQPRWHTSVADHPTRQAEMMDKPTVLYAGEPALDSAEFRRVLVESGLGETRPVDDPARIETMLDSANLILTARLDRADRPLVGVLRGLTDFSWVCYVSELAVSKSVQGLGVGRGLMDEARRSLGPQVAISLVSMPDAIGFYERIGMARTPDAFWLVRER
jgi:ribosomal protein S18 acetylase RimI-like enzyme